MKIDMKTYVGKLVLTAVIVLAAVSCNDMLDIDQHGVQSTDTYYSTDKEIEAASANIYIKMRSCDGSSALMKPLLGGDFWAGGGMHGENSLAEVAEYTFDGEETNVRGYWRALFNLVYATNIAIERVDPALSQVAKRTVAEALVLRSWAYFELTTMYGNPPLVDHPLQPDEYQQANGTQEELWGLVLNGYKDALALNALPEKSSSHDKSVWRVTKQYAQALYGKALIWQNQYAEAAQLLDEVISSKKYELFDGEFGDKNMNINKLNCEVLFESIFPHDPANAVSSFTGYQLGLRTDRHNPVGISQWGLEMGFGFCQPTKDLYDAFREHDNDGYRLHQTMKNYDEMLEMNLGLLDGQSEMGEGVYMWKDRYTTDKTPRQWTSSRDVVWMRLAEVYLLAAEAHLATGNTQKATDYVNVIRRKARIPDLTSVTLFDIKAEKRFELCREGQLYQDLQRWGDAEAKLKNKGIQVPVFHSDGTITQFDCGNQPDKCGYKKGKHEYLPIPTEETRVNPNIIQNPGY